MKRSPMPRRRKPMKRVAMKAAQSLTGRRRGPQRRSRPRTLEEMAAFARCHARPRCEAETPVCTGRNAHAHHRQMESQGGPTTDDNLLAVCLYCHTYIHAHPAESYRRGWLISAYDTITPYERNHHGPDQDQDRGRR